MGIVRNQRLACFRHPAGNGPVIATLNFIGKLNPGIRADETTDQLRSKPFQVFAGDCLQLRGWIEILQVCRLLRAHKRNKLSVG